MILKLNFKFKNDIQIKFYIIKKLTIIDNNVLPLINRS